MTSADPLLDADIARIAALRGVSASDYVAVPTDVPAKVEAAVAQSGQFERVFIGCTSSRADLEAFDKLPTRSRAFLTECPIPLNTPVYLWLLSRAFDETHDAPEAERALIKLIEAKIPSRVRWLARDRYGSTHPQARSA